MTFEDPAIFSPVATTRTKPQTEAQSISEGFSQAQDIERFIPPPRSPSSVQRIRVQNRRRRYLERHPSYFEGESFGYVNEEAAERKEMVGMMGKEAVDPLLYDRLVRRFQTAEERAAGRRTKGFAATLSADLSRAEARLAAMSASKSNSNAVNGHAFSDTSERHNPAIAGVASADVEVANEPFLIQPDSPTTRAEGLEQWRSILTHRFISGLDPDFDYAPVDGPEENDGSMYGEDEEDEMKRQERWFEEDDDEDEEGEGEEEEDEEIKIEANDDDNTKKENKDTYKTKRGNNDGKEGGRRKRLTGETGIQDF